MRSTITEIFRTQVHRGENGRFLTSGNPGGRPKIIGQVREAAQRHAGEAVAELVRLMTESGDDRVRLGAANALLDRAVGKPEAAAKEQAGNALLEAFETMRANGERNAVAVTALTERYRPNLDERAERAKLITPRTG